MSRIVVDGAGVGGLAAAARLAATGHDVTVCEQAAGVGGKLGWQEIASPAGIFGFDTGPSLVTMPHVLQELFRSTGEPLETVLPLERTTLPRPRFADGSMLPPAVTAADFLGALDPAGRADWSALMRRAGRAWDATREPFLERPLRGVGSLMRMAATRPRDIAAVAPLRTLRAMGNRHLRDPRLRQVLDRYATYTGSDPRRAPAALLTVPWVEQEYGAWYVPGGLHRLGTAIRDRAGERGARILLGTDVTAIETVAGRVSGVRLADGGRLAADVVVANVDAAELYGRLLPHRRAARRIARAPASYSGFVLLIGIRDSAEDAALCHHEVLFPADYDAEFDALATGAAPVGDPTIYLSRPADPALAPAGHAAWFVLVNAPRQDQMDWDTAGLADSYADRIIAAMAARGIDVRSRIVARHLITPADLARRTRAAGGGIYGTSSNGPGAAFLRPANRSPVPGLFLVGGSSHPGGGLPLVTLSARIVSTLIGPAS